MNFSYKYLLFALLLALILAIISYFFIPLYSVMGINKALEGVLLLSSISLGFYGACLSVFASIFNTKTVKELMQDNEYRKEFIVVSISSLSSGFFTVFSTIVYQVMLENQTVSELSLRIMNTLWLAITFLFLAFNILFVLISFLIFFSNTDMSEKTNVHPGEIPKRL